jgi:hypothetical protein
MTDERADGRDIKAKEAQQTCARKIRELNKPLFTDVPDKWAEWALRAAEVYYRRTLEKRTQRSSSKRSEGDDQKIPHPVLQDQFLRLTNHDLQSELMTPNK